MAPFSSAAGVCESFDIHRVTPWSTATFAGRRPHSRNHGSRQRSNDQFDSWGTPRPPTAWQPASLAGWWSRPLRGTPHETQSSERCRETWDPLLSWQNILRNTHFSGKTPRGKKKLVPGDAYFICHVFLSLYLLHVVQPNPASYVPYQEIGENLFLQPVRVPDFQVHWTYPHVTALFLITSLGEVHYFRPCKSPNTSSRRPCGDHRDLWYQTPLASRLSCA